MLAHSSAPRHDDSNDNRLAYIRDLLKHNPSVCAYDDVSGKPLSWGLMLHDGAYGFAYTVPEARNKQVFALVAVHSVQQMTSHGVADLFGYAAVANRKVQRAVMSSWTPLDGYLGLCVYSAPEAKL